MSAQAQITIDKNGHITACNDVWDRMMRTRRLRHLTGSHLRGQEFRPLIPTSTRRQIADGIILAVREQAQTIRLDCRAHESGEQFLIEIELLCNQGSEDDLRVTISAVDGENICMDSEKIDLVNMCSHCRRIRVNDDWVDVIEAVQSLHLLCLDPPPPISHGLCGDCFMPSTD